MTIEIDPTAITEEIFPLNEDLSIHYTTFRHNYVWTQPAGSWRLWRKVPFVAPTTNSWINENYANNIEFECCEHVSVVLSGEATYTFTTGDTTNSNIWSRGSHNVDNGFGYLPTKTLIHTFRNNFSQCCILQPIRGLTNQPIYNFEVITGPQVLTKDALGIHFCTGNLAKQTQHNISAGTPIDIAADDIAIIIYVVD